MCFDNFVDNVRIEFRTIDGLYQSRQIPHVNFLQNRSCTWTVV